MQVAVLALGASLHERTHCGRPRDRVDGVLLGRDEFAVMGGRVCVIGRATVAQRLDRRRLRP